MERRTYLTLTGATILGTTALSGCIEESPGDENETTTTATETTTTTMTAVTSTGFAATSTGCGNGESQSTVTFDEDAGAVEVTGTIVGSDGCATAELADSSYDQDTGVLSVTVATTRQSSGNESVACIQCLVDIDYEATIGFSGRLPERVTVTHDGQGGRTQAASAERPS
jgi:hypothetical protein